MTYPNDDGGVSGALSRDVEMAKAAILYADRVDLVSTQATLLAQLADLRQAGLSGMFDILRKLDGDTLTTLGADASMFTPEVRELLPMFAQFIESEHASAIMPPEILAVRDQLTTARDDFQAVLIELDSSSGASELRRPINAGLLRVTELAASDLMAATIQAAAGTRSPNPFDAAISDWIATVIQLLEDPTQRVILDPHAVELISSLAEGGFLNVSSTTEQRSRAAHLGAGFIGRLPTLPQAPFDELLDLRAELSGPLTRYRSAVVKMSRSLTKSPFEHAIRDEADDLWTEFVAPAMQDIEDAFTDHGLVREIARTTREDARQLVMWGSGLLVGLEQVGHLSALVSSTVGVSADAAGVFGTAINRRREAIADARRGEMFYIHQLGHVRRPSGG